MLADMLAGRPDTRPGLMFGFPASYAAGKLVACVYGTGLGLRLPPEEAAENILTGIETRPKEMVPDPMECGGMWGSSRWGSGNQG